MRGHEGGLAVLGAEPAVGVEALGADDAGRGRCRRGGGSTLGRRDDAALLALANPRAGVALAATAGLDVADGRLLEAVGAHGPQARIGDVLAALGVQVVAVHEGVFFGLPVEALELVGVGVVAHGAEHPLHVVGDPGRDQAVGHGVARAGPCSAR